MEGHCQLQYTITPAHPPASPALLLVSRAHFCNLVCCRRARAKLQQEARAQIDATLTKLVPAFDLRSTPQQQQQDAADTTAEAAAGAAAAEEPDGAMEEALEQLYLPVRALCSKGRYKASQLQLEVAEAAAEAARADAAAASAVGAPAEPNTSSANDQQAGEEAAAAAEVGDEAEQQVVEQKDHSGSSGSGSSSSQLEQLLQRLLSGLRSAAVKSLAEVAAGQLMLLLSLGRSVAAVPR
jgi:hypothetical protein